MTGRAELVDHAADAIRSSPLCQLGVTPVQAQFAAQAVVDALHPEPVDFVPHDVPRSSRPVDGSDGVWVVCARTPDGDEHAKAVCTCTPDPCAAPVGLYAKVNSWVHGPACQVTVAAVAAAKARETTP